MADEALTGIEGTQPAPAPETTAAPSSDGGKNVEDGQRAADVTGEKGPIPYERFSKVNDELKLYKELGYAPDQLRQMAETMRRAEQQAQYEQQRQQQEWARTPEGQRIAERRQAFGSLLTEFLGERRADAFMRSLDNFERVEADQDRQRITDSRSTLSRLLSDEGVTFTAESKDDAMAWENAVAAHIQHDDRLNGMYFNPETREAAIKEAAAREVAKVNRALVAQGASELRAAAARRAAVPRTARGTATPAGLSDLTPKSTNRTQRGAEWKQIGSNAIDQAFADMGW